MNSKDSQHSPKMPVVSGRRCPRRFGTASANKLEFTRRNMPGDTPDIVTALGQERIRNPETLRRRDLLADLGSRQSSPCLGMVVRRAS